MTLDQLIEGLEKIRLFHGGDLKIDIRDWEIGKGYDKFRGYMANQDESNLVFYYSTNQE